MTPIIEVSKKTLKALNPEVYNIRDDLNERKESDDFIYLPFRKIYVAKERSLYNKNWFEAHKELQSNGERMLILPEFIEFLKYSKDCFPEIYQDITEARYPWRVEWLDADFKMKNNKLYINYNHIVDKDGKIIKYDSEILDKNTLMKNKIPGISLQNWLDDKGQTKQGLPNKNIKKGDLSYWNPMEDNNSVAGFGAGSGWAILNCDGDPSGRDSNLGVRAVRHE